MGSQAVHFLVWATGIAERVGWCYLEVALPLLGAPGKGNLIGLALPCSDPRLALLE